MIVDYALVLLDHSWFTLLSVYFSFPSGIMATRSVYKDTPYYQVMHDLRNRRQDDGLDPEHCPKCPNVDLYNQYDFKTHLERSHPSDIKHKPYVLITVFFPLFAINLCI